MNFREELKKVSEGKIPLLTVEERAERCLSDLIWIINQHKISFGSEAEKLLFQLTGEGISVKRGMKYINNLYVLTNHFDSDKIFEFIREKLRNEGFEIKDETDKFFTVILK